MSRPWARAGEHDAPHALGLQLVEEVLLDPAVQHGVRRLVDQQRSAEVARDLGGLAGVLGGVGGDPDVQRPAGAHGGVQRADRLLQRGLGVVAVAVEDVDVVQAHPGQRLVQGGQHVLARPTPLAVGPRPHVVAGLGADHQLVPQAGEVSSQVGAEVLLRPAVGRAVVVGQVEVGHAAVEGPAQDRALGLLGPVGAEVLPQPEGERREAEPAAPDAAVVGVVVAVLGGGVVVHARHCAQASSTASAAAPTMPAVLRSVAETISVRMSSRGMNDVAFLLTPPPTTNRSGEKSFSSVR